MIKSIFVTTLIITTSIHAMDIPSDETTRYIKTHPSIRTLIKKKSFIRQSQQERKHLKEKLEDKPECFWMWTPEEGAFHNIYEAKNKQELNKIINHCNPALRMDEYSVLSSIMLSPYISFHEKKETIANLLPHNYTPTIADIKLNLLETWDRCERKKIIQKICLFIWMHNSNLIWTHTKKYRLQQTQKDIIQTIARLTFNTESLL
jgi:hypothetical protein